MKALCTTQSAALCLEALLREDSVTALRSEKYLSTRTSNIIRELRKRGLVIDLERVEVESGSWYGIYRFLFTPENLAKARKLLDEFNKELSKTKAERRAEWAASREAKKGEAKALTNSERSEG
ncbi:hypothetical protein FACS1894103_1680 [Campylobacterota bacterium]|nr:hypothetical protein FACS1894103_1680 [Campylobacterota bacterium]